MSQPDATLYIQPPMFETTVAVQITANVRLRNGAHAVAGVGGGEAAGGSFARGALILLVQDSVETHANSKEGFSRVVCGDERRCRLPFMTALSAVVARPGPVAAKFKCPHGQGRTSLPAPA
jgi:hypothetical protein